MSDFNTLKFVGDNPGLNMFEALEKAYQQGAEEKTAKVVRDLRIWAMATKSTNPDIAIGYEHAIAVIEQDLTESIDEWDGIEKCCLSCVHKKTHDELTENGNVPMCCLHCKYAEDLYDKWEGAHV